MARARTPKSFRSGPAWSFMAGPVPMGRWFGPYRDREAVHQAVAMRRRRGVLLPGQPVAVLCGAAVVGWLSGRGGAR